jgi:serine/threonine protein kinase
MATAGLDRVRGEPADPEGDSATSVPPSTTRTNLTRGLVRFGNYDLILLLGHGGMADVFLASYSGQVAEGFNKLTVLKRLRENFAEDPDFIEMLVDEARLAARLNHPNVVQTNEIGLVGKQYFISMEYLDGQPLHRIILRAKAAAGTGGPPVPENIALTLLCDVLAGLHHAHELTDYDGSPLNIVHRDVSPQNVFVTYAGQVKLVDFGIAKAAGRSAETREGVVKGKIAYMAPEQPIGALIDRRADLFAVGIVLWELLTGTRMWKGLDDVTMFHRLIAKDIQRSPKALNPNVPDEVDRICQRALAPNPDERYPTAAEFQTDLERYLRSQNAYASARELGDFVSQLFADKRAETRSVIEARLAEVRARGNLPELRDGELPPTSMALRVGDRADPMSAPVTVRPSPPVRRGRGWLLGAGVAMAALGLAAVVTKPSLLSRFKPQARASQVESPPVTPQEELLVRLEVRASPADATLYLDAAPLPANPTSARFPRDKVAHTVHAEAAGYQSAHRIVSFDTAEQKVEFELVPAAPTHAPVAPVAPTHRQPPPAAARAGTKGGTQSEAHPSAPRVEAPEPPPSTTPPPAKSAGSTPALDTGNPWGAK